VAIIVDEEEASLEEELVAFSASQTMGPVFLAIEVVVA
jgi:hypothetical protein